MASATQKGGPTPAPRGASKGAGRPAGSGRQIDLGALVATKAGGPPPSGQGPAEERRELTPRRVPVSKIAPNPLNRHVDPASSKVRDMAASLRRFGQLSSIPVVSRLAFVAKFPEFTTDVGNFPYVQVNGGYRHAASLLNEAEDRAALGESAVPAELDIVVRNELVASRAEFVAATAAENLDRNDYNPIEEAHAVALIVREVGAQDQAAQRLGRSKGWVTQRMNLLQLASPVQDAVAIGNIPLREARQMHTLPEEEQLAVLADLLAGARSESASDGALPPMEQQPEPPSTSETASTTERDSRPVAPVPTNRVRATRLAAAIKRLGQTPPNIADALVGELPKETVLELVNELQARLARE